MISHQKFNPSFVHTRKLTQTIGIIIILLLANFSSAYLLLGPAQADFVTTIDTELSPDMPEVFSKGNPNDKMVYLDLVDKMAIVDSDPASKSYNTIINTIPSARYITYNERNGYTYVSDPSSVQGSIGIMCRHNLGVCETMKLFEKCGTVLFLLHCRAAQIVYSTNTGEIYVHIRIFEYNADEPPGSNEHILKDVLAVVDSTNRLTRIIEIPTETDLYNFIYNPWDHNIYSWGSTSLRKIDLNQNPVSFQSFRMAFGAGEALPCVPPRLGAWIIHEPDAINTATLHDKKLYVTVRDTQTDRCYAGSGGLECTNDGNIVVFDVDPRHLSSYNKIIENITNVGKCPSHIAFSQGKMYVTHDPMVYGPNLGACDDPGDVSVWTNISSYQKMYVHKVGRCPAGILNDIQSNSMYVADRGMICHLNPEEPNRCPNSQGTQLESTFSVISLNKNPIGVTTTLKSANVTNVTGSTIPIGTSIYDTALLSSGGTEFQGGATTFKMVQNPGCYDYAGYFLCNVRVTDFNRDPGIINEIRCFGKTSDLSSTDGRAQCLSNNMKELDCDFHGTINCTILSNDFEIIETDCTQHEHNAWLQGNIPSERFQERFSCAVHSPTNQDISMIHCSGNVISGQTVSGRYPTECIDNNANRVDCDLSVITWFCHARLVPVPQGELVYYIFPNSECKGIADSKESVKLNDNATVPNSSKVLVGSPGNIGYRAIYWGDLDYKPSLSLCEPVTFSSIFTQILNEEGQNITATTVHVGDIIRDSATIHRLGNEPFAGRVTYYMYNSSDSCLGEWNSETVDVQPDGKVPSSSPHEITIPHKRSYNAIWDRFPQLASPCEPLYVR